MKNDKVRFHSFLLKNEELSKKWLVAMKREDFVTTKHSRICGNRFISLDYYPPSRTLLKTSVSFVDFLQHVGSTKGCN